MSAYNLRKKHKLLFSSFDGYLIRYLKIQKFLCQVLEGHIAKGKWPLRNCVVLRQMAQYDTYYTLRSKSVRLDSVM